MSRPETAPMKFGDDWTGVFIRGDEAGGMSLALEQALEEIQRSDSFDVFQLAMLKGLQTLLISSDERAQADNVQRMRAFEQCGERHLQMQSSLQPFHAPKFDELTKKPG